MSNHANIHKVHRDLPIVLVGSFAVGYVAGKSFAVVYLTGQTTKKGVERVADGAAALVARRIHWSQPVKHAA
ncbi:hypothetical protein [Nocardioides stalactiti]|uniref:hypothetical protein n=1 Tax=Nocardioides stalactiti TaxID=2755356 RepID=UPI001600AF1F|nr:hypothetical protein [Nocardioides stalactiti]